MDKLTSHLVEICEALMIDIPQRVVEAARSPEVTRRVV